MKLSCPPSNLLLREGTNVHPAHGDRGSCERRRSPRKKRIKVGTLTLMRRLREMGRRNRHCPDMHHAFKSVRRQASRVCTYNPRARHRESAPVAGRAQLQVEDDQTGRPNRFHPVDSQLAKETILDSERLKRGKQEENNLLVSFQLIITFPDSISWAPTGPSYSHHRSNSQCQKKLNKKKQNVTKLAERQSMETNN